MEVEPEADEPDLTGWSRRAIPSAGVSIAHNPAWPVLEADKLSYQTFGRQNGAVSVQWGEEATMSWFLRHTGLGSGGHRRTIDEDRACEIGPFSGRRVRIRVTGVTQDQGTPGEVSATARFDDEMIFVAEGFVINGTPLRVGYRLPAPERLEFEPLLERVLHSVRPLGAEC